jgi:hypothetical protein
MASRSHTTYKKRQKELARLEKQRDKIARRMQRKLEKNNPAGPEVETDDAAAEDSVADSVAPDVPTAAPAADGQ